MLDGCSAPPSESPWLEPSLADGIRVIPRPSDPKAHPSRARRLGFVLTTAGLVLALGGGTGAAAAQLAERPLDGPLPIGRCEDRGLGGQRDVRGNLVNNR